MYQIPICLHTVDTKETSSKQLIPKSTYKHLRPIQPCNVSIPGKPEGKKLRDVNHGLLN